MNKLALFSVPRSGSTWLGQIINSSPNVAYRFQPNFAYSFPDELTEKSSTEEINNFFNSLLKSDDAFVNARISISGKKNIEFPKSEIKAIIFKETHFIQVIENLMLNSETKVIGLVRSPFATINSWLNTPKEFHPDWNVNLEWENAPNKNNGKTCNYFGYKKWKETIELFLKLKEKYNNQFLLVNYEDLLNQTLEVTKKIFDFCEIELKQQTEDFILTSSQKKDEDPYSVFKIKKKDDQWKDRLPNFIIDEIKKDQKFQELNKLFKWI